MTAGRPTPDGTPANRVWLNWPNRITLVRILLIGPLVICLLNLNEAWHGWRYCALGLFVVMALSDALDGFLARRLREESALGRFLDPLADKLLVTSAVIILAIEETAVPGFQLPRWVPVIAVGKDLIVVLGFVLIYLTTSKFYVQARIWGKACTLVQLVMVTLVLVAPDLPAAAGRAIPAVWWAASALAVIALIDYVRDGNRFAAAQWAAGASETSHDPRA